MHLEYPHRLKKDAIVEAIFEIRFDSGEVPEIVIGKFIGNPLWNDLSVNRLSNADIPSVIRETDPKLKYLPIIEKKGADYCVRFGPNAISFHKYPPYEGWETYGPILADGINAVFDTLNEVKILRTGLRYINALTTTDHLINSVNELAINVSVVDEQKIDQFNLAHGKLVTDGHKVVTKIATTDFIVKPTIINDPVCVLDIDVFSPERCEFDNFDEVRDWLEAAHKIERESFYNLFPPKLLDELKEE